MSLLIRLPIIKGWLEKIDLEIGGLTFPKAMQNLLERHGAKLKVLGKDKYLTEILRNASVVVVSNHPNEVDVPILLASLEPRDDLYMVAVSVMMGFSKNLDKHLIPVYVNHRMKDRKRTRLTNKFFRKVHMDYGFSQDQAHQKNIGSIDRTSEILSNGGMVVIFPEDSDKIKSWQPGIGYIINGLKEPKKTFVVEAFIENSKMWHLLGVIPFVSKLIPTYRVTLSRPILASKFCNHNPKVTTRGMELDYKKWVSGLAR